MPMLAAPAAFAGPGDITTVAGGGGPPFAAGDGGPATLASLSGMNGVVVDGSGNLFISHGNLSESRIRKVTASTGRISTYTSEAQLFGPNQMSLDSSGNLFVAVGGGGAVASVRKITPAGVMSTVAGGGSLLDGASDGGPATQAELEYVNSVLVVKPGGAVPAGTLYLSECEDAVSRVRRVDPSGRITTVAGGAVRGFSGDGGLGTAAKLDCPRQLALDPSGNLYIADEINNRIRKVNPAGVISTFAGDGRTGLDYDGPATAAHINGPRGLVFDAFGSLYVAETGQPRIRRIDTGGRITTIAGTGLPGFSGDGGRATAALLNTPTQLAINGLNLYVADTANSRIRKIELGQAPPNPRTPQGVTLGCGSRVTSSLTLTRDVGPCSGDGLIVAADNITVNLNGFRIFGTPGPGTGNQVGIRIENRRGVTINGRGNANQFGSPASQSGTVTNFDAGVGIIAGSGNTVRDLIVADNVGPPENDGPLFSEGIAVFYSANNRILNNQILRNGTYDNIGVLGPDTNGNVIQGNRVEGSPDITGVGIVINAFLDFSLSGRGGSISRNDVLDNVVVGNYYGGMSILGNTDATIARNRVERNGFGFPLPGNGIGVQNLLFTTPFTRVLITDNVSNNNAASGIQVRSRDNRIQNNTTLGNGAGFDSDITNGLPVDLMDFTPFPFDESPSNPCLNTWSNNTYNTAWPECPKAGGHEVAPASGAAAARLAAATAAAQQGSPPPDPQSEKFRKGPPRP